MKIVQHDRFNDPALRSGSSVTMPALLQANAHQRKGTQTCRNDDFPTRNQVRLSCDSSSPFKVRINQCRGDSYIAIRIAAIRFQSTRILTQFCPYNQA
jgi:hypothetical protein